MTDTIQILTESVMENMEEMFPMGMQPCNYKGTPGWNEERAAYALEHITWIAEQLAKIYGREFVHWNVRSVIVDNLLRQLILESLYLIEKDERSIKELFTDLFQELVPVMGFDVTDGNRFYVEQLAGQFVNRLQEIPDRTQLGLELLKDALRLLHLDFAHPE